jgi:hypothetical protein
LIRRCINEMAAISARARVESSARMPAILFDSRDNIDQSNAGVNIKKL